MTKEQEEAIKYLKNYKYDNEVYDAINIVLSMLEEKDKQIDLMAEDIYNSQIECNRYFKDKKEVKQYFENKAKEVE